MKKFIGLGHKARHGKDTVADYLVENHGFTKLSWADTLKNGINVWHGWGKEHGWGKLKEVEDEYWGYSPRTAYTKIGTELMRDQWNKSFWVKSSMLKVKRLLDAGEKVVMADVRFIEELNAVRELGGEVWKVFRPGMPETVKHASETALDGVEFDKTIINDGTLEELYEKVEVLYEKDD